MLRIALGAVVLLVSVAGGGWQRLRAAEEAPVHELLEAKLAITLANSRTVELRRSAPRHERHVVRDLSRASALMRGEHRGTKDFSAGHRLANGLNAPLRC